MKISVLILTIEKLQFSFFLKIADGTTLTPPAINFNVNTVTYFITASIVLRYSSNTTTCDII